jgi:anti-anti-sigma regulatory factor
VAAPWPAAARADVSPLSAAGRTVFVFALDAVLDTRGAARAIRAFRNVRDESPIVWLDCSDVRSASHAGALVLSRFADVVAARATLRLLCVPPRVRPSLAAAGLARFFWEPESPSRPVQLS